MGDRRRLEIAAVATCGLAALGAVAVLVATWSLREGSIGWGRPQRHRAALATRSIDPARTTLRGAYSSIPGTSEIYGVPVQQAADLAHRVTTGSSLPFAADDPATYAYQASVTLILALVAVSVLAVALGSALRSAPAGAFARSLTLWTSLWLGMSTVDYKDVPVAAGLTLETAAFVLAFSVRSPGRVAAIALRSLPSEGPWRWRRERVQSSSSSASPARR